MLKVTCIGCGGEQIIDTPVMEACFREEDTALLCGDCLIKAGVYDAVDKAEAIERYLEVS